MCSYDLTTKTWTTVKPIDGEKTPKPMFHDTIVYRNYLILYGGHHNDNAIYFYNFETNIWTKNIPNNSPSKRYYHQICTINDKLIIFGGKHPNSDVYSIDIFSIINPLTNDQINMIIERYIKEQENIYHLHIPNDILSQIMQFYGQKQEWTLINYEMDGFYGQLTLTHKSKLICVCGNDKSYSYKKTLIIHYDINNLSNKTVISLDSIGKRYLLNGCWVNKNNKLYIFIYGGWCPQREYLDDSFLIEMNL